MLPDNQELAIVAVALVAVLALALAERLAQRLAWTLRELEDVEIALDKLAREKRVVIYFSEKENEP